MSGVSLDQVEQMAMALVAEDQLVLVKHLVQHLRLQDRGRSPQDLYGDWRGKVPEDFDIDSALREIRSKWQSELDE